MTEIVRKKRRRKPRVQELPCLRYLNAWFRYDPTTGHLFHKRKVRGKQIGDRADYMNDRGYMVVCITFKGKTRSYKAHRIIYAIHHQTVVPVDMQIDHDSRIRHHNTPDNLNLCTAEENMANQGPPKIDPELIAA